MATAFHPSNSREYSAYSSSSATPDSSSIYSSSNDKDKKRADAAIVRIVPHGIDIPQSSLPLDRIVLCDNAKLHSKVYCGSGTKPRVKLYKRQHPHEYNRVSNKTTMSVLKKDVGKNAKIMAFFVTLFGGLGAIGFVGSPLIGGLTTGAGVGIGVAISCHVIKKRINEKIAIDIEISDHYLIWRAKAIADKVYPLFKNFVDTDKKFEEFMCPIAQDICSLPMLAPDGHTYNLSHIYAYIDRITKDPQEEVVSPLRGKSFCKNDLVFDTDYCRRIINKAERVYAKVKEYGDKNVVRHGLTAVISNTREVMEKVRKQVAFQLWDAYDQDVEGGIMTEDERSEIIRESTAQWDFRIPKKN